MLLEGVALLIVMALLARHESLRQRFGFLTGAFLCGYGVARITAEFFREPDAFLGFLPFGTTMGQILSVPMILAGIWLIARAKPARPA
jgi:phosphatidylglycerol:prolipoprotein diacylglycerol transferase